MIVLPLSYLQINDNQFVCGDVHGRVFLCNLSTVTVTEIERYSSIFDMSDDIEGSVTSIVFANVPGKSHSSLYAVVANDVGRVEVFKILHGGEYDGKLSARVLIISLQGGIGHI